MSMLEKDLVTGRKPAWHLAPPFGWRALAGLLVLVTLLGLSAQRVEVDRFLRLSGEAIAAQIGLTETSQVGEGLGRMVRQLFPLAVSERTEIARIPDFDPEDIPPLARIETVTETTTALDSNTLQMVETTTETAYLIEPYGYLQRVLRLMLATIEMGIWGTIIAVTLGLPLAIGGARNYTPHRSVYYACRALVSFFRSLPELIVAMFLVLAFGFGPVAGMLALGIHSAGFLGKFYAEDIEDADRKPQEALVALGAGKLRVLRAAVLPQVLPSYVAYTLYILDRNVRMATVVGLVGAGGIGLELKGRFDMFEYDHVGTILVAIFTTVLILDQISARLRARLIG
jgi:phosphonate transport system permease protein